MKVAVACKQGGLNDEVSPIVGRAPAFTLVEINDGNITGSEVVKNEFAQSSGGAGIQSAQMLVGKKIDAILGGNFGPNLAGVFSESGVEMYQVGEILVEEAVVKLLNGELSATTEATGPAHGGTRGGGGAGGGRGGGRKGSGGRRGSSAG